MEEDRLIPTSMIRQYCFCPQIPYLNYVLHISEPDTESMSLGKEKHEAFHAQYFPRKLKPCRFYRKVSLKSEKLGLKGVIDTIVETKFGELIPCEFKLSNSLNGKAHRKDKLQLVACSMLIEESFGKPVKRGFIYYAEDGKKLEILISDDDRKEVMRIISKIKQIIDTEEPPSHRNFKNCSQCWYNHICMSLSIAPSGRQS